MKKIPFYKMKWFVGSKIQRDLISYILGMCVISQLVIISQNMADDALAGESYLPYMATLVKIVLYGYIVFGLWLSNRIAGPLLRLERHMQEVAEGKADSELKFRKKDYGADIADAFNKVVEKRVNNP